MLSLLVCLFKCTFYFYSHRCPTCTDATFSSEKKLLDHMSTAHDGAKAYNCDVCDQEFKRYNDFIKHLGSMRHTKNKGNFYTYVYFSR
jgi:hypothetical protein